MTIFEKMANLLPKRRRLNPATISTVDQQAAKIKRTLDDLETMLAELPDQRPAAKARTLHRQLRSLVTSNTTALTAMGFDVGTLSGGVKPD